MRFVATAEHTGGQGIGHSCCKGVWSDPADLLDLVSEAESYEDATTMAVNRLQIIVEECGTCDCARRLSGGSKRWWDDIVITVAPEVVTSPVQELP
jgi:hypothetical protein